MVSWNNSCDSLAFVYYNSFQDPFFFTYCSNHEVWHLILLALLSFELNPLKSVTRLWLRWYSWPFLTKWPRNSPIAFNLILKVQEKVLNFNFKKLYNRLRVFYYYWSKSLFFYLNSFSAFPSYIGIKTLTYLKLTITMP